MADADLTDVKHGRPIRCLSKHTLSQPKKVYRIVFHIINHDSFFKSTLFFMDGAVIPLAEARVRQYREGLRGADGYKFATVGATSRNQAKDLLLSCSAGLLL